MPSNAAEAAEIIRLLRQASLPEQATIYELGCGWGTLVIALARAFPNAQIRGIEISHFPYWMARLRTRNMRNVFLQRGNFYTHDLQDADAITCYLMTEPMSKLARFLDTMLKPGTPVVSLTFSFRGRKISSEQSEAVLYYWPATNL